MDNLPGPPRGELTTFTFGAGLARACQAQSRPGGRLVRAATAGGSFRTWQFTVTWPRLLGTLAGASSERTSTGAVRVLQGLRSDTKGKPWPGLEASTVREQSEGASCVLTFSR